MAAIEKGKSKEVPAAAKNAKGKNTDDFEFDIDWGGAKPKKIYRGSFLYIKNNATYCEEHFEVYKDKKELTLNFISSIMSRVSTGEFLKLMVDYKVSKDYVPLKVSVKKDLGSEKVEEIYLYDSKKNVVNYTFKNKRSKHRSQINTSPRFHIFTPAACTSMLFFLSKKFDATSKNIYSVISSPNQWEYEHELKIRTVALERVSLTTEAVNVNGTDLQAIHYRLTEDVKNQEEEEGSPPAPTIQVYLSRHQAIPYSLVSDDGTTINIKFLNNLEEE
ncbi:MAG: hypothetical protein A2X86_02145 [Bdellovibrionales bacterium GWA2_49_15]|nr:MAG: hypothetical protein A2X86_02145 [Bdellovibrionales bacterium GWA2_49_15]